MPTKGRRYAYRVLPWRPCRRDSASHEWCLAKEDRRRGRTTTKRRFRSPKYTPHASMTRCHCVLSCDYHMPRGFPTTGRGTAGGDRKGDSRGTGGNGRQQEQAYMMPRMDPRTQLKCDRGERVYRYRLVRTGGGSGSFSVGPHRFASLPSSCGR